MKILAFAGTHENGKVADAFLHRIHELGLLPDAFISVGDLGPSCAAELFAAISPFRVPLLYVLGNHTLHYPDEAVDHSLATMEELGAVHLQRDHFELGGFTFVGQDAWSDFTDDERDTRRYHELRDRTRELAGEGTILVTHHAPLGIFDSGFSYPLHAYHDREGNAHAGSLALRFFVEEFRPRIHIFAHCHSDGCRSSRLGGTLYANVCHLERRTRSGEYGVTGSFAVVDTDELDVTSYHLSPVGPSRCVSCGHVDHLVYRRCVNCTKGDDGILRAEDLP